MFKTFIAASAFCAALTSATALVASPAAAQEAQQRPAQVQAQEQSWTGKVEAKEMNGSKVYVFVVGGKSYALQPQAKAADFEGKTVKITGTMSGNTVTISDIQEA